MRTTLTSLLWVGLGGAIGSIGRWWLSGVAQRLSGGTFPWGTLAVNALGSVAVGLIAAWALERALVPPAARLFLITGVLGGFTTFSAFSYETLALLRDGQWGAAIAYAGGSVLAGVVGAFAGLRIGLRA